MNAQAITVRALTRRFGEFTAVDRITFDVAAGEVFGFLGPNGAGKTTTIKMLTGLLAPSSGEAVVAGIDVARNPLAVRRNIGYMSQRFSLYGDLTVAENIDLFGGLYGVEADRLEARRRWVLQMAGLEGQSGLLGAELPLGWKQRLALGCAVLHEPAILFLDEPTSGVDPIARRAFWDLIYDLSHAGTTVLVSTHYMEEAEYCNRVLLMNRGRVIAEGRPADLRAAFREPIIEVHVARPADAVAALQATAGVDDAAMFGRAVHVAMHDEGDAERRVRAALEERGLAVSGITRVKPSLEDVFVSLVRRQGGALEG
ncbi:MAG TPA: ABC transporter ATP-binding protein [Longimicrobiales bacterium]